MPGANNVLDEKKCQSHSANHKAEERKEQKKEEIHR